MAIEIQHVLADSAQLANMIAAARAGKLVATPPSAITRAAGWLPSAHFVPVVEDVAHVASKLAEYAAYDEGGQLQLETIRKNGMALSGVPSGGAPESPGGSWPEASRTLAEPAPQDLAELPHEPANPDQGPEHG